MMAMSSVVLLEPAPTDLLAITLLPVALLLRQAELPRRIAPPAVLLWVFLIGNVLSISKAIDPLHAIAYAAITGYLVLLWILIVSYLAKQGELGVRRLWSGYLVAATVAVVATAVAYFVDVPWRELVVHRGYRGKGLFKDANVFGPFLVPVILYCMVQYSRLTHKKRLTYLGLAAVLSCGVILSFSRGAWVNLFVSVSVLLFATAALIKKSRRGVIRVAIGITLALIAIPFVVSVTGTGDFLSQRAALQAYDQVRFTAQRQALATVIREPLGIGPGQANEILIQNPHNAYLHVAAENGWIGAVGFIGLIVLTFYRTTKGAMVSRGSLQDQYLIIGAALMGVLVNSIVIDSLHWRHLWLLLAVPWGLPLRQMGWSRAGNLALANYLTVDAPAGKPRLGTAR